MARLAGPGHARIGDADGISVPGEEGVMGLLADTVRVVSDREVLVAPRKEEAGPPHV